MYLYNKKAKLNEQLKISLAEALDSDEEGEEGLSLERKWERHL